MSLAFDSFLFRLKWRMRPAAAATIKKPVCRSIMAVRNKVRSQDHRNAQVNKAIAPNPETFIPKKNRKAILVETSSSSRLRKKSAYIELRRTNGIIAPAASKTSLGVDASLIRSGANIQIANSPGLTSANAPKIMSVFSMNRRSRISLMVSIWNSQYLRGLLVNGEFCPNRFLEEKLQ